MSRRFIYHGLNSLTVPDIQLLAFTSIESLISSWRSLPRSRSLSPDHQSWNRYLEYLATIASFGNECWIIAHASLCWLPMLVKTTTSSSVIDQYWEQMTLIRKKFVRRLQRSYPALSDWRSVVKYYPRIRRSSLARTTPRIERKISPPPPTLSSPSFRPISPPLFVLDFEDSTSPYDQMRTPSPGMIILPPVLNRHKRKRRKRKRRMDKYRSPGHVRPPLLSPLPQLPLAVTSVTNRHMSRSCGSINARDPPDRKRRLRLNS
jgi:hypothetical protein